MKLILTFLFLLFFNFTISQNLTVRVQLLRDCYETIDFSQFNDNPKVSLTRMSNHQDRVSKLDLNKEIIFDSLFEDTYKLIAGFGDPFNSDTVIFVEKNLHTIRFCIDSKYRPLSADEIQILEQQAKEDIQNNRLKLYRISTDYPLSKKKKQKMEKVMKANFEVECEYEQGVNLYSREGFVNYMRYSTYNKVVMLYLDEKYGVRWRKTWKSNELSFPLK